MYSFDEFSVPQALSPNDSPFHESFWRELDTQSNRLPYEPIAVGDTGEQHSLHKSPIIVDEERPVVVQKEIAQLIEDHFFSSGASFLRNALGIKNPLIMRAQAHILEAGSFIGYHVDNERNSKYLYSLTFHFKRDYSGGLFRFASGEEFNLNDDSLVVCPGGVGHEVTLVENGQRKTLAVFVGEEPN